MSTASKNPGVISMQRAIDHYFELALYLLVLSGFGTLVGTGGLDLLSTVLVATALAIRGYLLAKRRSFVIPERWTTPLSVLYFVFFAIDYAAVSRSFLSATIHLALFGVVVRMFSLRRERDHITLAILAFLMVLASAVLTVDSTFLFCFAAFMLMAIATFVLMEMRRSGLAANIQARHSSDPHEHRHLAFSLVRFMPALMLMILIWAAGLFFVMPRMSAGYLGGYSYGTDFSSGFSDHVQLGQIGQIQQSNSVVMHIQIEGDKTGLYDLHWRGVSLADFDGHTWSNQNDASALSRRPDTSFALPSDGRAARSYATASLQREKLIHYKVLMEPIGTNVFFLAPWAFSLRGDYRQIRGDSGGAIYDYDFQHAISRYEATSDIATPTLAELRTSGRNYPANITETYLRLPEHGMDPRIPQLASQITRSAKTDFDKATVIENYLRTRFGYTLQLPQQEVKDPIANFLFERKRGHCEYFASSMAVMLRTLGIPSRVVNGFRSDEFNDITGSYVVRAKDAHSWVEAYYPGYGWQTFDPTPASSGGTPHGWGRFSLYMDAAASFWRDWVITYDSSNQYMLTRSAINTSHGLWDGARLWARAHYASMLLWARSTQQRVESSPRRWMLIAGAVILALLVLANMGQMVRMLQEKRLGKHPERSPDQAAALWYQRMTRLLARAGLDKAEAETAQEFIRRIPDGKLRVPVTQFTYAYESARFGNSSEDARRLAQLFGEVEAATRSE
ncbi:MAG TPA: transglutaminaseTgpA domain-containing protein [Candidatus Sulfotelmatobacter sp.]|nr:transglutaminaseTgpA domain-containing protein [Candidatus Sulfotelmatobacter sp.]